MNKSSWDILHLAKHIESSTKELWFLKKIIYIIFDETHDFSLRKKDIIDDDLWTLSKGIKNLIMKEVLAQSD